MYDMRAGTESLFAPGTTESQKCQEMRNTLG